MSENISNQTMIKVEQAPTSKQRLSNFDLLKIIAFIFVVVLHFNGLGKALDYAESNKVTELFFMIGESIAIVAVPVFVLITGYFSINNKSFTLKKVLGLYIMLFAYKALCYLFNNWIFGAGFSTKYFLQCFLPNNYFINFYTVLMVLSPFLNKLYKNDKKNVFIFLLVFSVFIIALPTVMNMYIRVTGRNEFSGVSFVLTNGTANGYSLIAFIFFYLVGGFLSAYDIKVKLYISIPLYVLSTIIITLLSYKSSAAWYYDNIFVIISAVCLMLIFKEIKLKEIKAIGFIAKCSLGVFVLHTTPLFVESFNLLFSIQERMNQGPGHAILVAMAVISSTLGICVAVDILLRLAVSPLRNILYKTKFMNYKIFTLKD